MSGPHIPVYCPICGSDYIVCDNVLPHDGRIFEDAGQCQECETWLAWDGQRVRTLTARELLRYGLAERAALDAIDEKGDEA